MQQKVRNDKPFVVHDIRFENPSLYIGPPDFPVLYKKEKNKFVCIIFPVQIRYSSYYWAPEIQWA